MAAHPTGQLVQAPAKPPQLPSSFLQNRVSQLQGLARSSQAMTAALKTQTMQAPSRDSIYAAAANKAAQAQAAAQQAALARSGQVGGLERANTVGGYSDEAISQAAAGYAGSRAYAGGSYVPHMVMQEGDIEVRNGVPGVYGNYMTGGGSTTEWTPLQ